MSQNRPKSASDDRQGSDVPSKSGSLNVSIIGTGYVGLVTGCCLAASGHRVICVDRLGDRIERINRAESPFFEPDLDALLRDVVGDGRLTGSTDLPGAVAATDVTLIAVGTPDLDGQIDLSQIEQAARDVGAALRSKGSYHVVAVKSTVVPGTTDGIVRSSLEQAAGKPVGADFGLCMNPEFLREGSAVNDFMHPDRIIIGTSDDRAAAVLKAMYAPFDCPKLVVSPVNAELTKYASNALLATLISFSNELASLCEHTPGADAELVMDGLHLDKRLSPCVGSTRVTPGILAYLRPSSGYGGSCLPKDVSALLAFARSKNLPAPLLTAVAQVNEQRTQDVLDIAEERLGGFAGRSVGVLGLAFKAGTDDLRHSPAIKLVEGLRDRGASVTVFDPVAMDSARPLLADSVAYCDNALDTLADSDVAVIGTSWPEWAQLDWTQIKDAMKGNKVLDARNSLRSLTLPSELVVQAIGRGE